MTPSKIQELLEQSKVECWGNCPYNGSPVFEGYEVDQEKFASLIVAACADAADNGMQDDGCAFIGDYVGESLGFGTEEGIAAWRANLRRS